MALQITIAQSDKPTTAAGEAREDLALGTAVSLTATGGSGSFTWSLHDAPLGAGLSTLSAASLSSSSANPVTITPDNEGTYFVKCVRGTETVGITFYAGAALAANPANTPRRVPAFDEELEHTVHDAPEPGGNTKGWKRELDRWFAVIRKIDEQPCGIWSQGGNLGSDEVTPKEIIPGPGTTFSWDGTNLTIGVEGTLNDPGTLYWGVGISIPTVEADILALVNSEARRNFLRRISIAAASQRLIIAYRAQWGAANVRFVTGGFGIAMVWTTITVAGVLCNVGYSFAANMTFPLQDLEIY